MAQTKNNNLVKSWGITLNDKLIEPEHFKEELDYYEQWDKCIEGYKSEEEEDKLTETKNEPMPEIIFAIPKFIFKHTESVIPKL